VESLLVWAGTDAWRAETAHVRLEGDRLAASGVQLGVDPLPYRLDYLLETGPAWATRVLEVSSVGSGWRRSARLERDDDGRWTYHSGGTGDVDLPEPTCDPAALGGALDCDLGLSPLTNAMPLLRSRLHREPGAVEFTMAWMSVPDLAVVASVQRYEHLRTEAGGAVVRFTSGSFTADLTVDADGFVIDYPELGRRVS
jgi:uncharacterized protein